VNTFIALEGLSASGKTTIGMMLAKVLQAVFYKTPSKLFSPIRKNVDRSAHSTARFFYYMAGVCQASLEIKSLLTTKPVVCDRYILTTVCYHKVIGVAIDPTITTSCSSVLHPPDYTLLITCEQKERIRRLNKRGLTVNDSAEQNHGIEEKFLAEYLQHDVIEIDNSGNDPNIAVKNILAILKG